MLIGLKSALNAISDDLIVDLTAALDLFESMPSIGCLILTGTCHMLITVDVSTRTQKHLKTKLNIVQRFHLFALGHGRAFAAGADIKEMKDKSYFEMSSKCTIAPWERLSRTKLPIIAAVNGIGVDATEVIAFTLISFSALGGGCEIAMMCDILLASEKAKFGQPEINLGAKLRLLFLLNLAKSSPDSSFLDF